jgi:glycosyltransferase involved in cell wall biosynthesis
MMASISSSREWLSVPLQRSQPESSRNRPTLVSLNRFEAKKNIKLALTAFKKLETDALIDREVFRSLRLVIAGESYMAGGLS